jgi:probable ATP-dependent RNA helicase DDX4
LENPTSLVYDENHCEPQVVIMAPTRELVVQIFECVWKFSKGTDIRNGLLYGGTSVGHQKFKIVQVIIVKIKVLKNMSAFNVFN